MKRVWNILLLLSFQFGYLEWGKDQHLFLFQAIGELYAKARLNPLSVLHPLTILPFIGMLLFLLTIFQKTPSRLITFAGAIGMISIMLIILLIGLVDPNCKMLLSALPFFTFLFFVVKSNWRKLDI